MHRMGHIDAISYRAVQILIFGASPLTHTTYIESRTTAPKHREYKELEEVASELAAKH